MGRVKRYKRIKAIDPLNPKTHGIVDFDAGKDINRAPSRKDVEAIPRSVQRLLQAKGALEPGAPSKEKAKPERMFAHIKPLAGESMTSFHRRINTERSKQLTTIRADRIDSKTVNDKRSAYLQKKKEKKKQGGLGINEPGYMMDDAPEDGGKKRSRTDDDEDDRPSSKRPNQNASREDTDEFPTERISFGERAMEPPKLLVAPRKSQKQKMREAMRTAQKATIAAARSDDASDAAVEAASAARSAMDATRAEEMKKAQMQRYRASVQEAYAAMKKKKKDDRPGNSGGGGSGGSMPKKQDGGKRFKALAAARDL